VNNLGALYSKKQDHARAEPLYRRAIDGYSKILGPDHPHSLMSVNNLANTLSETNCLDEAQKCYERALAGYSKTLGEKHPYTLMSLQNLANLKRANGQLDQAEREYRQTLQGWETAYSTDHPYTLGAVSALGSLLNQMGRCRDAANLLSKYAEISKQGMESLRYNLACYECLDGNLEESKRLIKNHLTLHPEEKEQALADSDLEAIRDFIETL
jgi:tetratricopeptide (TPR) repeat protein